MKRTWSQAEEYGELGIIESIRLQNFMCHENLSFDFDPHMNFITGRNGSGKSAVLTGIILALGGKSGTTGRYSNVKGFIKTGKNSATVAVTLKNCGPEAYKPDEFGKKITVERHFTSDGISSYKLKSEIGRIISTSKEELMNILNVMDIQVDNPITVLTQETSRNFLLSKNSRPQKLYELFYKGTGLQKVHDDYTKSFRQKDEAKDELLKKKSVIPEMEKDIKKAKAILEKSTLVPKLKKDLLWAIVIELEKKRDEAEEALKTVKKEYLDLKRKLELYEAEVANNTQSVATVEIAKKDSKDKMDAMRKDLHELNQKKNTLSSDLRKEKGRYESNERMVKKYSDDAAVLENIINEIRMKNQNDVLEDKLRHEREKAILDSEISSINSQIELLIQEKNILLEHTSSLQNKVVTCNAEIQEINYDMINIRREKQQLTEGMANRVRLFGPEMANVLRDIDSAAQAGRFQVKPKGPIGLYINVRQPKWTFAVQECLKVRTLRTFICDNHSDADFLTKILNKHYQRNHPSLITTKFVSQVYDVSAFKTMCEHPTVLDMLEIEDPVITNCLIDQARIENILLIADPSQALKLMLYHPPQSCKFAYTPNGDQYCHSPFRNYSCRNMNQICMLKTVNEDDIRKKDGELNELKQSLFEKQSDLNSLKQQISMNEQEIRFKDTKILQAKGILNEKRTELKNKENTYEEPKDIDCLSSELILIQKVKREHEEVIASCSEQIKTMSVELESLDRSIDDVKRNLQFEQRNFYTLSEKANDCQNKKEKYESAVRKVKDQLQKLEPVVKQHEEDLANESATVTQATSQALATSPRVETERSSDAIRELLRETEKFIKQQRNSNREAIANEYKEKMENYKKAKIELQRQEKIQSRLENMLTERLNEFQKIRKNTSVNLTCHFTTLLRENNFTGYPDVSFERKTLDIIAKPEKINSSTSKDKHSLTQLSGGERSYVTIAFLLSLWEQIHMPFRVLDEYDVFMDSNNRHLSINLLINTAKANKKVQYIFLSPLELPQIEGQNDHVKVHKMPDPRK